MAQELVFLQLHSLILLNLISENLFSNLALMLNPLKLLKIFDNLFHGSLFITVQLHKLMRQVSLDFRQDLVPGSKDNMFSSSTAVDN